MTPEELFPRLDKFARSQGIELNADRELTLDLLAGLLANEARYGYRGCPCRLAKNDRQRDLDIICPCKYRDPDIAEFGSCYCGLYVSKEWNSGKITPVRIPERRPKELR